MEKGEISKMRLNNVKTYAVQTFFNKRSKQHSLTECQLQKKKKKS